MHAWLPAWDPCCPGQGRSRQGCPPLRRWDHWRRPHLCCWLCHHSHYWQVLRLLHPRESWCRLHLRPPRRCRPRHQHPATRSLRLRLLAPQRPPWQGPWPPAPPLHQGRGEGADSRAPHLASPQPPPQGPRRGQHAGPVTLVTLPGTHGPGPGSVLVPGCHCRCQLAPSAPAHPPTRAPPPSGCRRTAGPQGAPVCRLARVTALSRLGPHPAPRRIVWRAGVAGALR